MHNKAPKRDPPEKRGGPLGFALGFNKMNIQTKALLLFSMFFVFSLGAKAEDVRDTLKDAVTCGINPLDKIRKIVDKGNQFKKGHSVAYNGDGSAETAIVILEKPIEISGSSSFAIFGVADLALYFDFNGLVFGRFKGDYKKVVTDLKLNEVLDSKIVVGKFERKLGIDSSGKPYDVCPMTIGLTPLKNGEFLLGCGWCNG